jgi:AraC-like DNA-binding protein
MNEVLKDKTKFGIAEDLEGLQFLSATFVEHNFPRHYHSTYVIIVQVEGVEDFFCRGANHLSPAGSLVFINPGEIHTGSAYEKKTWAYKAIYPTAEFIRAIASESNSESQNQPIFNETVVFDSASALKLLKLHRILENSTNTLERQTLLIKTLQQLIKRHSSASINKKPAGSESLSVNRVRDYLEANYNQNLRIEEIAALVDLNPFYLIRAFKRKIGIPPHEYQIQIRIQRSMNLIREGMPLADVALETGFSDQSHFSNRFKKVMGITPKQFAKGSISYKI